MQNANSYYVYLLGTAAEFSYFIDGFHFFSPSDTKINYLV